MQGDRCGASIGLLEENTGIEVEFINWPSMESEGSRVLKY